MRWRRVRGRAGCGQASSQRRDKPCAQAELMESWPVPLQARHCSTISALLLQCGLGWRLSLRLHVGSQLQSIGILSLYRGRADEESRLVCFVASEGVWDGDFRSSRGAPIRVSIKRIPVKATLTRPTNSSCAFPHAAVKVCCTAQRSSNTRTPTEGDLAVLRKLRALGLGG